MLYLLDTSQEYDVAASELGVSPEDVGQLITPLTSYSNRGRERFAIDNGAYSGFEARPFLRLLERELPNKKDCLFVVAPDVVCSARRTLEVFDRWYPKLQGWPIALACQNGQEDLPIPWDLIDAVFIGGDTAWKLSCHAEAIVRAAKILDKWVHVGRVNSAVRLERVEEWGVDSIDGTGISRYTHMRQSIAASRNAPRLRFADGA